MSETVLYTHCPVCSSAAIQPVLTVKDHSVSGQAFVVMQCADCALRFTQDVPGMDAIAPFYKTEDYISHTNTSKGLVNRIYQMVRKRTMTAKRKMVEATTGVHSGTLLDLGSGVGSFAHTMQDAGWKVTGLEPDPDARKVAEQLYGIKLGDASQLYHLPPGSFDAITMWHVLEHVHDLSGYIAQLKNLLKENGRLLIAVPNYTSLDAQVYREYWAAYDVPRHLYHFSPRSIKTLMDRFGLKVQRYQPMWYDSFYISLLSSKYKTGRTNWIGAVWNGLQSNLRAMRDKKQGSSITYIISK